jgi:hypothetical protein
MAQEELRKRFTARCAVSTMTMTMLISWMVYLFVYLSEYCHDTSKMTPAMETNDYIIQYLTGSKTAVLFDKKNYQPLMLDPEVLRSVKNFTESCVQCKYAKQCTIRGNRTITVKLSADQVLTVFDFQKCTSPDNCHWFDQYFACSDLIVISSLIP